MAGTAAERSQQRLVCALLVAVGALVLPVSGAISYLDLGMDNAFGPWIVPFIGASNAAEVIGPVLLVGALGIGVVVARRAAAVGGIARTIGFVLVIAALLQALAFTVTAFDLVISDSYAIPDTTAWQSAKWTLFGRLALEACVCIVVLAQALRWVVPADRKVNR